MNSICSKCGFLKQILVKKTSNVQAMFEATCIILGKDTWQICKLERDIEVHVFGKPKGEWHSFLHMWQIALFWICSKCGFLKQMLVKKTSYVQARIETTCILGKDICEYTHRQSLMKKHSVLYVYWNVKWKYISVEKRERQIARILQTASNNILTLPASL